LSVARTHLANCGVCCQ